jgi:hypothetical protein
MTIEQLEYWNEKGECFAAVDIESVLYYIVICRCICIAVKCCFEAFKDTSKLE